MRASNAFFSLFGVGWKYHRCNQVTLHLHMILPTECRSCSPSASSSVYCMLYFQSLHLFGRHDLPNVAAASSFAELRQYPCVVRTAQRFHHCQSVCKTFLSNTREVASSVTLLRHIVGRSNTS